MLFCFIVLGILTVVLCLHLQIKRQFMSGSLALRAQFAGEGELNRDFGPVLATQMVSRWFGESLFPCCFPNVKGRPIFAVS